MSVLSNPYNYPCVERHPVIPRHPVNTRRDRNSLARAKLEYETGYTAPQDFSDFIATARGPSTARLYVHVYVGAQNGERFFKAGKQVTPTRRTQRKRRTAMRKGKAAYARIKVRGAHLRKSCASTGADACRNNNNT